MGSRQKNPEMCWVQGYGVDGPICGAKEKRDIHGKFLQVYSPLNWFFSPSLLSIHPLSRQHNSALFKHKRDCSLIQAYSTVN